MCSPTQNEEDSASVLDDSIENEGSSATPPSNSNSVIRRSKQGRTRKQSEMSSSVLELERYLQESDDRYLIEMLADREFRERHLNLDREQRECDGTTTAALNQELIFFFFFSKLYNFGQSYL
ncbi:hypothetical protein HHUSO_G3107 [Huso huso]|uniref:Uncharacterized protein n=1 Tax=Huso huso TaxID=61971 RepID=A0ABR1A8U8_HUSHU